jgi:isopentenyl phosphate kinase
MKRTTPSQEVSHFDIGWLAGIIDGEGSLAHYVCKRKGLTKEGKSLKGSPIYGVYVINSDMEILNKVKNLFHPMSTAISISPNSITRQMNTLIAHANISKIITSPPPVVLRSAFASVASPVYHHLGNNGTRY